LYFELSIDSLLILYVHKWDSPSIIDKKLLHLNLVSSCKDSVLGLPILFPKSLQNDLVFVNTNTKVVACCVL